MGASVVRAGICSGIFVLSYTLKRDVAPVNSLGFAAMSVCMFWPQGAVSLGFLLSFYSTLGAILFYHPVNNMVQNTKLPKLIKIILKPIVLTSSAQLFITPIMIVCYGKLTPIAILSNVVVGGLVGLIMCASAVGLILSAFVIVGPLSHPFCFVADKLSDFCLMWVEILSGFTNAEITVSKSETVFAILLLCAGVMMFMLSKGKKPPTIIGLSCVSLALALICVFSFLATQRVTVTLVSDECVAISYNGYSLSVGDCTSRKGDLRLERAVYASTDSVDLLDLHSLDQYSASISASSRQAKCVLVPRGVSVENTPYVAATDHTEVAISDDFVVTAGKGYTCVDIDDKRIVIAKKDADITQIKNVDYLIVEVDFNYDDKTWEVYEKANGLAIKDGKVYNVIGNNTYFSIDRFFGIIL